MLRWTPRAFREATVWEVAEAYEGYALSKGIKRNATPLTEEEITELQEWMDDDGDA